MDCDKSLMVVDQWHDQLQACVKLVEEFNHLI